MRRTMGIVFLITMVLGSVSNGQDNPNRSTGEEAKVWKLEQSYWEYAKALDVPGYKSLWREDFVGWPSTASAPMGKDRIGNWVQENRDAQEKLQCYNLEHAGFTQMGDVAIAFYYLTEHWLDKSGKSVTGQPRTIKVTHTWLRTGDSWQILGGMAAVIETRRDCDGSK